MIRKLAMTLCLSMCGCTLLAQNELQEINAIKSNINFLYATGTSSKSAEDASNNAKDLLALEIEQWLLDNTTEDIAGYVAKSRENLAQIKTRRGNLYRVFVYVKKKDVLPRYKEEEVMVVDIVDNNAVHNDSLPKTSSSQAETLVSDSKTDVPPAINVEYATSNEPAVQQTIEVQQPVYTPTAKEREMLNISTFIQLNDYINQGRANGTITRLGKYSDMPQSGLIYTFIHNREGQIAACMKVNDGSVLNLNTGKEDKISNYKGCGAIWIKLK